MEAFIIALLILLGIILVNHLKTMEKQLARLSERIDRLKEEMRTAQPVKEKQAEKDTPSPEQAEQPLEEPVAQEAPEEKSRHPEQYPEKSSEESPSQEKEKEQEYQPQAAFKASYASQAQPSAATATKQDQEDWWTRFLRKNPDLERFIGENLINKIGIIILTIGIGIFVKYAIDQNWIGHVGRVMTGILAGAVLIGIAHRLRHNYQAFSSVLAGGGIATLYFTIGIAFHMYHLLGQNSAFAVMVVITVFAVVLSVAYNRQELAVLALLGGFGTPFFVSTGEGNYVILFTYLLILNSGLLVLAFFKKWNTVYLVAYGFTIILFGGWLASRYLRESFPVTGSLIFATLFYLMFFASAVVFNLRRQQAFRTFDFTVLFSLNIVYYTAGYVILMQVKDGLYIGLFTTLLGILNLLIAWFFYRRKEAKSIDGNLIYLLTGLVLTYISLAAPVQLKGNHITLFWAAEAVVLCALYNYSRIKLVQLASVIIQGLMLISLMMDWYQVYNPGDTSHTLIFNEGFVTTIIVVASLLLYHRFSGTQEGKISYLEISLPGYRNLLMIVTLAAGFFGGILEAHYQVMRLFGDKDLAAIAHLIFSGVFFAVGLHYRLWYRYHKEAAIAFGVFGGLWLLLAVFYGTEAAVGLRNAYARDAMVPLGYFMSHYGVTLLAAILGYELCKLVTMLFNKEAGEYKTFLWAGCVAIIFFVSLELDHIIVLAGVDKQTAVPTLLQQSHQVAYPIAWGITSFVFMLAGMRARIKTLRVISLFLFLITLLKLFLWDIRDLPEGAKIAAFILLGVLLLVISFMYQKLKKLIFDDPDN